MVTKITPSSDNPGHRFGQRKNFLQSIWLTAALVSCYIVVLDVFLIFQNVYLIRYVPIFVILSITFVSIFSDIQLFRLDKPTFYLSFMILAFLISFPGALYNKIATVNSTNMLSLATNLLLPISAFLIPIERYYFSPARTIRLLFFLSLFYMIISALVLIGLEYNITSIRNYLHSRGFLLPLVFLPFLISRKWVPSIFFLGLAIVFVYVSAKTTMFLILVTSIMFVFTARLFSGTLGRLALICLIIVFSLSAIYFTLSLSEIEAEFKAAIGGQSNTLARIFLWNFAIQDFLASPVFGDMFTGKSTYLVELGTLEQGLRQYDRPVHNDVLVLLARGGVFGAGVFFIAFLGALAGAMKNYKVSLQQKNKDMAALNLILASALISAFISFLFNPVLNSLESGWLFYFILTLIIISHRYIQRMKPPSP